MLLFKRVVNGNKLIVEESDVGIFTTYLAIDKTERIWLSTIDEDDYSAVSTALCKLTDDVLFAGNPQPIIDALSATAVAGAVKTKVSAEELFELVEKSESDLDGMFIFSGEWITVSFNDYNQNEGFTFRIHGDKCVGNHRPDDSGLVKIPGVDLEHFLSDVEQYNDDRSGARLQLGRVRERGYDPAVRFYHRFWDNRGGRR